MFSCGWPKRDIMLQKVTLLVPSSVKIQCMDVYTFVYKSFVWFCESLFFLKQPFSLQAWLLNIFKRVWHFVTIKLGL